MRLIDADVLRSAIEESRRKNPHKDNKIALNHDMEHRAFCSMVASQPTAFDLDKVVEQLEENAYKSISKPTDLGFTTEYKWLFFNDVIEILKGGGMNG